MIYQPFEGSPKWSINPLRGHSHQRDTFLRSFHSKRDPFGRHKKELSYWSHLSTLESFSSLKPTRQKSGRNMTERYFHDKSFILKWIKKVSFIQTCLVHSYPQRLYLHKDDFDNYDRLIDPRYHIQNIHNNLELVIQDIDAICKIQPTTFKGLARYWYKNLDPGSITGFRDLCAKLMLWFNTNILANRSSTKLFGII
jgi:hypothetical protein